MERIKAKVRFIFEGEVTVIVDNKEQASEIIENNLGLVLGGNIHTNLNDDEIDWDFNMHPEKEIEIL